MASRKRPASNENNGNDSNAPRKTGKRQRVTCACDPCRLARERCDGTRPKCKSCKDQNRECKYTSNAKKRGVPTGYLKTIELSLAWLIEESPACETALHRLLGSGKKSARLLQCQSREGHRLQHRWSKSTIYESIGKLLSTDIDSPSESSEASDTEIDGPGILKQEPSSTASPQTSRSGQISELWEGESIQPSIKLPQNWKALIETYRSCTHCWFPLVSMSDVVNTASTYPIGGIKPGTREPEHAELWAVLALGAFQDPSSCTGSSMAPVQEIYLTARSLIPSEDETFEPPHLRAMLLHSLVLIGQGAELAAWLLIGTATRLSLHLKCTGLLLDDGRPPVGHRIRAACFILDILTSASLGYPSTFDPGSASMLETEKELRRWQDSVTSDMMPEKSFCQLFRFCCFIGQHARGTPSSLPSMPDLVESLDPVFAFCNNVLSDSKPSSPSALLIQLAFLVTAVHLSSDNSFRTSLATNLIEVVECCTTSLGLRGTPPLVIGLLGVFRRSQPFRILHESEKTRWQAVTDSLRAAWGQHKQGSGLFAAETNDGIFSQSMGMQTGLLSPDLSTLPGSDHETFRPQSSWQHKCSPSETQGKPLYPKTPWDFDLDGQFSSPSLSDAHLFGGSLELNVSATINQEREENMILRDLDNYHSPSELGVDARLISNLCFGASELDALCKGEIG